MNGKGCKPRPLSVPRRIYGERWDDTFGGGSVALAKIIEIPIPHEMGEVRCCHCGYEYVSVRPTGADAARLECPQCGFFDSEALAPKAKVIAMRGGR